MCFCIVIIRVEISRPCDWCECDAVKINETYPGNLVHLSKGVRAVFYKANKNYYDNLIPYMCMGGFYIIIICAIVWSLKIQRKKTRFIADLWC